MNLLIYTLTAASILMKPKTNHNPMPPLPKPTPIDWTAVDLTRTTKDLATSLGVSRQAIYKQRERRGVTKFRKEAGGVKPSTEFPLFQLRMESELKTKLVKKAAETGVSVTKLIISILTASSRRW